MAQGEGKAGRPPLQKPGPLEPEGAEKGGPEAQAEAQGQGAPGGLRPDRDQGGVAQEGPVDGEAGEGPEEGGGQGLGLEAEPPVAHLRGEEGPGHGGVEARPKPRR